MTDYMQENVLHWHITNYVLMVAVNKHHRKKKIKHRILTGFSSLT